MPQPSNCLSPLSVIEGVLPHTILSLEISLDSRCNLDDDVGLMGVRLQCSTLPTPAASSSVVAVVTSSVTSNITRVGGGSVLGYGWSNVQSCPRSAFLSGARLLSEFFILETVRSG